MRHNRGLPRPGSWNARLPDARPQMPTSTPAFSKHNPFSFLLFCFIFIDMPNETH